MILATLNTPWPLIYNMTSVDQQIEFLQNCITELYEFFILLKTKEIKAKTRPWFTKNVKDAIEDREKAFRKWTKYKTVDLNEVFKEKRKCAIKLIRKAKSEHFKAKFKECINNKQKWDTIKKYRFKEQS